MNQDLKWLAENEPQWAMNKIQYICKFNGKPAYIHSSDIDENGKFAGRETFYREQWQAARDDRFAPDIGVVEGFLGSPFTTPDEDEEWERIQQKQESSGGDNDYWIAQVNSPKRLEPYSAECEDLIELFQMTFQEGEAFKALWRKGQMRIGNGKPGDTLLRNSEKVYHFGGRMVAMEVGR